MDVIDDELIRKLTKRIEAEQERAEAEREHIVETRKLREAEQRREALMLEIIERYAHLGERIDGLLTLIHAVLEKYPAADIIQEWLEDLSDRIEEIRSYILVLAGKNRNADEVIEAATGELVESIKRQLERHRSNLLRLQEQKAAFGSTPPLYVINQIDDIEYQIERLEKKLERL